MSTSRETSLWFLLIPVALVLMALGAFLVFPLIQQATGEAECHPSATRLGSPMAEAVVTQALDDLLAERAISSPEDALEVLLGAGWVLDSEDGYRLEYWISFTSGNSVSTAGFAVICLSPDLDYVWTYDGIQTP